MSLPNLLKPYLAGVPAYQYPGLGEAQPPGGAKVLLLTKGCVCTTGTWANDGRYLAWSPLPARSEYTYPRADGSGKAPSGNKLLLTRGTVCVSGPWTSDGRYLGWAEFPTRDRSKEDVLLAQNWEPTQLLSA